MSAETKEELEAKAKVFGLLAAASGGKAAAAADFKTLALGATAATESTKMIGERIRAAAQADYRRRYGMAMAAIDPHAAIKADLESRKNNIEADIKRAEDAAAAALKQGLTPSQAEQLAQSTLQHAHAMSDMASNIVAPAERTSLAWAAQTDYKKASAPTRRRAPAKRKAAAKKPAKKRK